MSKRIQELAKQAGFLPGVMGLNRFTYFDLEKFAELIIQEWTGLTDKEIGQIYKVGWTRNIDFARAIEAKLKEKNT
jgi:hypothetical protein